MKDLKLIVHLDNLYDFSIAVHVLPLSELRRITILISLLVLKSPQSGTLSSIVTTKSPFGAVVIAGIL